MAAPRRTRWPLGRFRLAALSRLRALAPRGGHVALRARSFARRLRFLRLAFRGARLIHRRRRDPLGGFFRPPALLEICFDVVVLALALFGPGPLWHLRHLPGPRVQAACAISRRTARVRGSPDRRCVRSRCPEAVRKETPRR